MSILGALAQAVKEWIGADKGSKQQAGGPQALDSRRAQMRKAAVEALKAQKQQPGGPAGAAKAEGKAQGKAAGAKQKEVPGQAASRPKAIKGSAGAKTGWPEHVSANAFTPEDFLSGDLPSFLLAEEAQIPARRFGDADRGTYDFSGKGEQKEG